MDLTQTPPSTVERTLELFGRFDAHRCPELDRWLDAVLAAGRSDLQVDLSGITFVDSAALASLVRGMKRCREAGGDLVLLRPSMPARAILQLTRLDRAFHIVHGPRPEGAHARG